MMPPQLHFSNIHCKYFLYGHWHCKQKGTTNKQTNEGVYVGCRKIFFNSHMNEKMAVVSSLISKDMVLTSGEHRYSTLVLQVLTGMQQKIPGLDPNNPQNQK